MSWSRSKIIFGLSVSQAVNSHLYKHFLLNIQTHLSQSRVSDPGIFFIDFGPGLSLTTQIPNPKIYNNVIFQFQFLKTFDKQRTIFSVHFIGSDPVYLVGQILARIFSRFGFGSGQSRAGSVTLPHSRFMVSYRDF